MSDAEIDELLERFDATEPALQRRMVERKTNPKEARCASETN